MNPRRIIAELQRLENKLRGFAAQSVIKLVNDALKTQNVQLNILADETTPGDIERYQQYGFTSVPLVGAEAIVIHLGGGRDHGVVIATEDKRYRLKGLADGEVALYDDQGQKVQIKRDGIYIKAAKVEITDADAVLLPQDGVLTGQAIDPFTGSTHFLLGNASTVVKAKK